MVFNRKETRAVCREAMSIVWEYFVLWHRLIVFPHAMRVHNEAVRGAGRPSPAPSEPRQQFPDQRRTFPALGRIGPESVDHGAVHADAVG